MSLYAWFANDEVAVAPGASLLLPLRIQNSGETDESVAIVPAGPASSWIALPTEEISVAAGAMANTDLLVTPHALPTTNAGPTTVAIRLVSRDERTEIGVETTIDVLPFDDRRIVALQPVQRARRRATYEFMVENEGNNMASCRLRLIDPTDRVDGKFDPPAVGVPPGEGSLVRLRARAARQFFRRTTRTIEFEVEAEQQGHTAARQSMSLVQPPTVPAGVLWRLLGVMALLGAAVAAWFWVVQPAIEDAAADEVDRLLAETAEQSGDGDAGDDTSSESDTSSDSSDASGGAEEASESDTADSDDVSAAEGTAQAAEDPVPAQDEPAEDTGEPDFVRLKVEAGLTQTVDSSFTIPDGQIFDLTDVRVENPFNDSGVASLLVNGEEVFLWSLTNIRGSLFEPSITQKRLVGGDNVTFSVRCDAISDPFRPTCSNAVNVGGLVFEE